MLVSKCRVSHLFRNTFTGSGAPVMWPHEYMCKVQRSSKRDAAPIFGVKKSFPELQTRNYYFSLQFSAVQFSHSVVPDSLQPHAARLASLSITNSQSLLKLRSIESVMPSSHLLLCRPLLLLVAVLENMPHIFYLIWASPTKPCYACAHFTGEKCSERLHCPCTLTQLTMGEPGFKPRQSVYL